MRTRWGIPWATVALHFAHGHPHRVERPALVDAAGILLMNQIALSPGRLALPETDFRLIDRVMRRLDGNANRWGSGLAGRIGRPRGPRPPSAWCCTVWATPCAR